MLEKPPIDDAQIITCLSARYGLAVTALEFLPLGYDTAAGVYRVQANGQTYFLKVKSGVVDELSVELPHYLKAQGIAQAVAPLPATNGELRAKVDDFTLILYPFIEQKAGGKAPLSDDQWIVFGAAIKKLHAIQLPPELASRVPKDMFIPLPRCSAWLRLFGATIENRTCDHPIENQLAAFWKNNLQEIATITDRAEQLGRMVQGKVRDFVLCHADIHRANLLLDRHDRLYIVDWDQPVFAPRERDLQFVTVGDYVRDEREEALFFLGYGQTDIDPLVMAYYRYDRVMEDLAEFAERVYAPDAGDATKQDSANWFMVQFEPGGAVEAAHKFDHVLAQ